MCIMLFNNALKLQIKKFSLYFSLSELLRLYYHTTSRQFCFKFAFQSSALFTLFDGVRTWSDVLKGNHADHLSVS